MRRWYPELAERYRDSGGDWKKVAWSSVRTPHEKLPCVPLNKIFDELGVHHVDLFILDVEGAELAALETLEWDKVRINVLVVEVNAKHRPPGYVDLVIEAVQRGSHGEYDVVFERALAAEIFGSPAETLFGIAGRSLPLALVKAAGSE